MQLLILFITLFNEKNKNILKKYCQYFKPSRIINKLTKKQSNYLLNILIYGNNFIILKYKKLW